MIKDETEIETIRKACSISDQAFHDALEFIKPGKTEIEIANFLDFRMRELGAAGLSFDTILASGPCDLPASASQSAGITGMNHHTRSKF